MGYIAARTLTWGDDTLAPGDPVPDDEPGRDYPGMLHRGEIREADDAKGSSDSELRKRLKEAEALVKELKGDKPDGPHLVLTLTDGQAEKLAGLGLEGTVSLDDLDAALSSDDEDASTAASDGEDALPDGVVDLGSGWYQLPDGVTTEDGKDKVRGRDALDNVLKHQS